VNYFKLALIILILSFNFTNCSNFSEPVADELVLGTQCNENCDNLTTFKVANDQDESLDVRQAVESYLSILGMKASALSSANLISINNEKKRRRALLAQDPDYTKISTINILSQTSLAGEICRTFVTTDGLNSQLFAGVTFSQRPSQIPLNNWMNSVHSFALQAWGRTLTSDETIAFKDFIQVSMTEASRTPNSDKVVGTNSLESLNLGVMICTTVLASPEASSL
jgi:hypothetical protein